MTQPVLIERRGQVQWITINREPQRNALNEEVLATIAAAVAEASQDRELRAIVLTGAGDRAFCAGADLTLSAPGFAFAVDYARPRHYVVDFFKSLQECPLPVVARVNGHAIAGGFGLLCACDMAVAADDVRMGTSEVKIGVAPMMILPFLMRVLPARRVQEMCVTGELFSAQDAFDWGVLNYVVPRAQLDTKLEWLLDRITDKSPTAIRLGKQAYAAMSNMSVRECLEYAQVMVPVMASTDDAREGMAAFREKRPASWTGR